MPGAEDEARQWLRAHTDDGINDRISDVMELITGFASPYGVELLATVHWTATREASRKDTDPATLTGIIRDWNRRKERLFTEDHVRVAMEHLDELSWVDG
jgi:hypothetical protein